MDRRFQVFVSSTYTDLKEERSEVLQALLELDCMPSGMELFPAADDSQWEWIKKVIDESDYYLVIVGGRYGTISKNTGLSYTEMEYRYAVETAKPIIGFLHADPDKIEAGKSEKRHSTIKKLENFKKLVSKRLCKYWSSPKDLGAKVSRSITQLIKNQPAIGWIKADNISEQTSKELLGLRKKSETLLKKLERARIEKPEGIEKLAQGEDMFSIEFWFEAKKPSIGKNKHTYWKKGESILSALELSWDEMFAYLGPGLITPITEYLVVEQINNMISWYVSDALSEQYPKNKIDKIKTSRESFQIIKIQLRALNLITHQGPNHGWRLTPYGDSYLSNLLAVKKA